MRIPASGRCAPYVPLTTVRAGAGVTDVILPIDVKPNVEEDLTDDQTEGVTIHYASRIEDVLAVALPHVVHGLKNDEELVHQAA